MSALLGRLIREPNGELAAKAYCEFRSYVLTGLMSENDMAKRIVASTRGSPIPETEAIAAVRQGIEAAKRKPQ
jgi:hypothetical protein